MSVHKKRAKNITLSKHNTHAQSAETHTVRSESFDVIVIRVLCSYRRGAEN